MVYTVSYLFIFSVCLLFPDEELIKWGWPEDVWFHVDKLSSAHVYLRLRPGESLDDVCLHFLKLFFQI